MAKRPSSPFDKARTEATAEQGFEREEIKDALEAKRPLTPAEPEPADAPVPSERDDQEIRIANRRISLKPAKLGKRILDVLPDLPDIRDRIYSPSLQALPGSIYPSIAFPIRDQGLSSSCTGFALAHVIDVLTHRETIATRPVRVSARMLYEMAKRNDEWAGTAYQGSSIRGALSGFHRNGVCKLDLSPEDGSDEWVLTYEINKDARENRLGAYYRLQADLSDFHAALHEVGVIYASAQIHRNWKEPTDGQITPGGDSIAGHAFAIVGYDASGFWVLNSWGPAWGKDGIAHWRYEDWAATLMDAWVLQLGVRAPTAFSAIPRGAPSAATSPQVKAAPNRSDIVGHFINIDDGRYVVNGRYASPTPVEMQETVKRLTDPKANGGAGYDHLVIYCHGGLNALDDEASRIATWKRHDIFGRNGIYNFHLMWGSGFFDEAFGALSQSQSGRAAGWIGDLLFETGLGKALGSRAWRNMKQDAVAAFDRRSEYNGGTFGLKPLMQGLAKAKKSPKIHLVGHSAGSIVLGELLGNLDQLGGENVGIESIHLMAPACTTDFFGKRYSPYLAGKGEWKLADKIYLYQMQDPLERADTVAAAGLPGYGRSLLYLVSRAYEDQPNTPLAGMEIYSKRLPQSDLLKFDRSESPTTRSTTHGGFDNDAPTMTTIMLRIAGRKLDKPPTEEELVGY
ncbi:C1 family peptidase [Sinorhizobium meliloti]|uniref:C1 family peptidase n=1 Tax=Rhizobium meliloti TaxID=382 RepID=UPI002380B841|nr:C1 family peptidase [Sinorhizobium meliloti]MDE3819721.1 C1 family peptidase [Sinorhizobium meliloti]